MPPALSSLTFHRMKAFSLIELLTVIAIIALLASLIAPALSQGDAKKFTSTVNDVATILEQARTSAMAMNTYVWVGFEPGASAGESGMTVTAVASRSGEADRTKSNLQTILPPKLRTGVALDNNPAAGTDSENLAEGDLSFAQNWRGTEVTYNPAIQFNPRGEATITEGAQSRWVQFGLVAAKGDTQTPANKATIRVSGVSGQVVIDRQ